jgi:hypothetical protein
MKMLNCEVFSFSQSEALWIRPSSSMRKAPESILRDFIIEAADSCYTERSVSRFSGDLAVFRAPLGALPLTSEEKVEISEYLNRRVEGVSVIVVGVDCHSGKTATFLRHSMNTDISLDNIQQQYFAHLLKNSGCCYLAHDGASFLLPNGELSSVFYRVGNLQKSVEVLDDIFTVLATHFVGIKTIICDTWSISTLAYHLARRCEDFAAFRTIGSEIVPIRVRMFGEYAFENGRPPRILNRYVESSVAEGRLPILFFFSITASGRSWKALQAEAVAYQGHFDGFALYSTKADTPMKSACLVDESFHAPNVDENGVARKEIIRIDRRTYFPESGLPKPTPLRPHLAKNRSFFERYAGLDAFDVHRNRSERRAVFKHQAFHIHADVVFSSPEYEEAVKSAGLGKFEETVVSLDNEANRALIQTLTKLDLLQSNILWLDSEVNSTETWAGIKESGSYFSIIDSQINTATTIGLLIGQARTVGLAGKLVRIVFGIDRSEKQNVITSLCANQGYMFKNGVASIDTIEKVCLPNWDGHNCPWCNEERLLGRVDSPTEAIKERGIELEQSGLGGQDSSIFFIPHETSIDQPSALRFGPDSFILDRNLVEAKSRSVSDADIVVALSSAAQEWRNSAASKQGGAYVSPRNYVSELALNDPMIRASLWRVFDRMEFMPFEGGGAVEARSLFNRILHSEEGKALDSLAYEGILFLQTSMTEILDGSVSLDNTSEAIVLASGSSVPNEE